MNTSSATVPSAASTVASPVPTSASSSSARALLRAVTGCGFGAADCWGLELAQGSGSGSAR
eukprot:3494222-Prymnesium_polylepis.1